MTTKYFCDICGALTTPSEHFGLPEILVHGGRLAAYQILCPGCHATVMVHTKQKWSEFIDHMVTYIDGMKRMSRQEDCEKTPDRRKPSE